MCAKSLQLCLFAIPMDYCLQVSSVHWDSAGNNNGVSCHFLLQGDYLWMATIVWLCNKQQTAYVRHIVY